MIPAGDLPPPPPAIAAPVPDEMAKKQAASGRAKDRGPDFMPGDIEVKARFGFVGGTWIPWSILTAFVTWNEFQGSADVGAFTFQDMTIGFGVEAYYARPFIIERFSGSFASATEEGDLRWQLSDTGMQGRVTLHFTELSSVDAYGVGFAGPTWARLDIDFVDQDGTEGRGRFQSAGLRGGGGVGLNVVSEPGWIAGVELRYLLGIRYEKRRTLAVNDTEGNVLTRYEMRGAHSAPQGFAWMFHGGYRF